MAVKIEMEMPMSCAECKFLIRFPEPSYMKACLMADKLINRKVYYEYDRPCYCPLKECE